ncbi:MAG: MFS transporter [Alphaproteobacteria bacterium]
MAASRLLSPYRRNIVAVMITMAGATFSYSFILPLLSLILEQQGTSGTLIGLSVASEAGAIFFVAPFAPRLLARLGPVQTMLLAIAVRLVTFLLMPVFPNVWAWFPLRMLGGAGAGLMWIVSEAWINQTVDDHNRGRMLSLYTMALALGYALGPLILAQTGTEGWPPFIAGAAIMIVSAGGTLIASGAAPTLGGTASAHMLSFFRLAPLVMMCCFVTAAADTTLVALLPLYGASVGLAPSKALYLLTVVGIGGIVLQYPFGWLADRMDRRRLTLIIAILMLACSLTMPWALPQAPYNLIFAFVFGGLIGALYTMGNILMGERFRGADLATASTLYAVMWSLATLAGPPAGGLGMDLSPDIGLPLAMALMIATILPFAIPAAWRSRTSGSRHA